MVLTWGDVSRWDPEPLNTAAADLNARYTKLVAETEGDVRKITAIEGWRGEAATAAVAEGNALADMLESYAADIAALRRACADTSDAIAGVKNGVAEAEGLASAQRFTINPDNSLTDHGPDPGTPPDQLAAVTRERQVTAAELADRVAQVLRSATDVDEDFCVVLDRIVANQTIDPTQNDNTQTSLAAAGNAGQVMGSLSIPSPPAEGATAAQNAAYWATLSGTQRTRLATDHPGLVGPRDGFTAVHRHLANRELLGRERTRLQGAIKELGKDPAAHRTSINVPSRKYEQMQQLKATLAGLDQVQARLDSTANLPEGERSYLLGINAGNEGKGTVIVAKGNPDTAQNVATYVPGTGSGLASISGDLDRSDKMWDAAGRAGSPSTSVITWAGYDAPPDLVAATSEDYAGNARQGLAGFQEGLRESHQGPPSHTTVLGHSYGSTVIGHTARDLGINADDLVFAGSPGVGVDHAHQLRIDPSHVHSTVAEHDAINLSNFPRLGGDGDPLDPHGPDPADPEFGGKTFTSNPGPSGWLFGNSLEAHSQYWEDRNPSLKEFGQIIAGKH